VVLRGDPLVLEFIAAAGDGVALLMAKKADVMFVGAHWVAVSHEFGVAHGVARWVIRVVVYQAAILGDIPVQGSGDGASMIYTWVFPAGEKDGCRQVLVVVAEAKYDGAAVAFLFSGKALQGDVMFLEEACEWSFGAPAWHVDEADAEFSHGGSDR